MCQINTIIPSSGDENTHSEHIHQSLGVSSHRQLAQVRRFLSSSSFTSGLLRLCHVHSVCEVLLDNHIGMITDISTSMNY